jgi:hypothetical protein
MTLLISPPARVLREAACSNTEAFKSDVAMLVGQESFCGAVSALNAGIITITITSNEGVPMAHFRAFCDVVLLLDIDKR